MLRTNHQEAFIEIHFFHVKKIKEKIRSRPVETGIVFLFFLENVRREISSFVIRLCANVEMGDENIIQFCTLYYFGWRKHRATERIIFHLFFRSEKKTHNEAENHRNIDFLFLSYSMCSVQCTIIMFLLEKFSFIIFYHLPPLTVHNYADFLWETIYFSLE